ncbi:MAG: hypothetical protein HZRFUVUK_001214 [Candidatus Fervidibacterota bacterium]
MRTAPHHRSGISLIEVLVVIALLVVGLWLMINVFPTGQRALRTMQRRNYAKLLATRLANELASSAKLHGGLVPDDRALWDTPFAEIRRLDLPIDKNGDGTPDEPADGKRCVEDLLELHRRLRQVIGEELNPRGLTALAPIGSQVIVYKHVAYERANTINEVTVGSRKYFVDRSVQPNQIVVRFDPSTSPRRFCISYIASDGTVRLSACDELHPKVTADASGDARITPTLLSNPSWQLVAVTLVKEEIPSSLTLTNEQMRAGVILIPADDDGDGRVDEDPIDGVDNDGDGKVDEDPPAIADYILGTSGAWITLWGRTEVATSGNATSVFDPTPKPLLEKKINESSDAGVAAFEGSWRAIPDGEFEVNSSSLVFFSTLSPDTLIRLAYRCAKSQTQTIDNWFFMPFIPPAEFTPTSGTPTEPREYVFDPSDRTRIWVAGMWTGLLINIVYVDSNGLKRSVLRRVEYDAQKPTWKGVINLPTPYSAIEKVEGASAKAWVSSDFFLGAIGGKRKLGLNEVIEHEALIRR